MTNSFYKNLIFIAIIFFVCLCAINTGNCTEGSQNNNSASPGGDNWEKFIKTIEKSNEYQKKIVERSLQNQNKLLQQSIKNQNKSIEIIEKSEDKFNNRFNGLILFLTMIGGLAATIICVFGFFFQKIYKFFEQNEIDYNKQKNEVSTLKRNGSDLEKTTIQINEDIKSLQNDLNNIENKYGIDNIVKLEEKISYMTLQVTITQCSVDINSGSDDVKLRAIQKAAQLGRKSIPILLECLKKDLTEEIKEESLYGLYRNVSALFYDSDAIKLIKFYCKSENQKISSCANKIINEINTDQ